MKIITILIAVLLVACKPSENKSQQVQNNAEAVVKKYLDENLDDPKSYEPLNFQPVDSIRQSNFSGEYVNFIKHGVLPKDTVNHAGFYGYTVVHEYRAKNKAGGLEKNRKIFYLSKDLSRVVTVN